MHVIFHLFASLIYFLRPGVIEEMDFFCFAVSSIYLDPFIHLFFYYLCRLSGYRFKYMNALIVECQEIQGMQQICATRN